MQCRTVNPQRRVRFSLLCAKAATPLHLRERSVAPSTLSFVLSLKGEESLPHTKDPRTHPPGLPSVPAGRFAGFVIRLAGALLELFQVRPHLGLQALAPLPDEANLHQRLSHCEVNRADKENRC